MTKAYYLGCDRVGNEILEGEIMGNVQAAEHNRWRESIKDINCSVCGEKKSRGIYLIENDNGDVSSFYCTECSRENSKFEEHREKEEFNITDL
jgi:hypothetical protein